MTLEELGLLVEQFKIAVRIILTKDLDIQDANYEKIWSMGTFPMEGAHILCAKKVFPKIRC